MQFGDESTTDDGYREYVYRGKGMYNTHFREQRFSGSNWTNVVSITFQLT